MTDKQLKEEVSAWLAAYVKEHFPEGLPEKIEAIVLAIAFDSFLDGVRYGQEVVKTESAILHPEKGMNRSAIQLSRR